MRTKSLLTASPAAQFKRDYHHNALLPLLQRNQTL